MRAGYNAWVWYKSKTALKKIQAYMIRKGYLNEAAKPMTKKQLMEKKKLAKKKSETKKK